jgi:hypothetical protein
MQFRMSFHALPPTPLPKFCVNSTVFFQIWPKIRHSSLECLQQLIDFRQPNFSPPGVLVRERDGVSRPPAFG